MGASPIWCSLYIGSENRQRLNGMWNQEKNENGMRFPKWNEIK